MNLVKIANFALVGLAAILALSETAYADSGPTTSAAGSNSNSNSSSGSVSGSTISAPLTASSSIDAPVSSLSGASVSGGFSPKSSSTSGASVSNVSPISNSGASVNGVSSGASVNGVSPTASITTVTNYRATPTSLQPLQTPTGTIPQIFGSTGRTANSAGLGIQAGFLEACHPEVATNGSEMVTQEFHGSSKLTVGHWTPYPDYSEQDPGKRYAIHHVGLKLPGNAEAGEYEFACLGTIMMEAEQNKAPEVDFSTITSDAVRFVGTLSDGTDSGDGTSHVYMIFVPQSISASNGMNAGGWSVGIAPTSASLVGAATSTIGLAGGLGFNKAHAFEKTQVGATYVLVAIKKYGTGGVKLNYHMLEGLYGDHPTLQPSVSKAEEDEKISQGMRTAK